MRNSYNKLYLPMPNRPKISNCILICKSHSSSNCSSTNPNTMKLYRSNSSHNRPQTNFINTILPRKLKL
uniref:Uncharacterized protein n=1 Tax=Panthera leo TaxID=9689 RepID=A0A8C8WYN6_PANLE